MGSQEYYVFLSSSLSVSQLLSPATHFSLSLPLSVTHSTHTHTCEHTCTHAHTHSSAWSSVPQLCHVTDLLVVDLRLSLAYFMMTHPLPIAGKLPIKVRLLGNYHHTHTHTHTHILTYCMALCSSCIELFSCMQSRLRYYFTNRACTQSSELSSRGWLSGEELETLEYLHVLERFYPNESYDEAHNLQPNQPRSESAAAYTYIISFCS